MGGSQQLFQVFLVDFRQDLPCFVGLSRPGQGQAELIAGLLLVGAVQGQHLAQEGDRPVGLPRCRSKASSNRRASAMSPRA
jgi:hypothetical protein